MLVGTTPKMTEETNRTVCGSVAASYPRWSHALDFAGPQQLKRNPAILTRTPGLSG